MLCDQTAAAITWDERWTRYKNEGCGARACAAAAGGQEDQDAALLAALQGAVASFMTEEEIAK